MATLIIDKFEIPVCSFTFKPSQVKGNRLVSVVIPTNKIPIHVGKPMLLQTDKTGVLPDTLWECWVKSSQEGAPDAAHSWLLLNAFHQSGYLEEEKPLCHGPACEGFLMQQKAA